MSKKRYIAFAAMIRSAVNIYKVCFLLTVMFPLGLEASPFGELHVSGPCEVNLIFSPDSAGIVTVPRNAGHDHGLEVRRVGNAMYIVLPTDSIVKGRLHVNVYNSHGINVIDGSGRALIKAGDVVSDSHLSVIASGAASVELGDVSSGNINVSLTGSGMIKIRGEMSASNINFSLTGSGKIEADALATTKLSVTQRGSGKIMLRGSAHNLSAVGQGSGMIDARGLVSADMSLKLFGHGSIYYPAGVRAKVEGKTDGIHAVKPYQPL